MDLLSAHCQKHKLQLLQRFEEDPIRPLLPWKCTLTIERPSSDDGSMIEASARAPKKSVAKKLAAQKLLRQVSRTESTDTVQLEGNREEEAKAGSTEKPNSGLAPDFRTKCKAGKPARQKHRRSRQKADGTIFHVLMRMDLLEQVWPSEKLLLGLQVCRWMRRELPQYVDAIVFKLKTESTLTKPICQAVTASSQPEGRDLENSKAWFGQSQEELDRAIRRSCRRFAKKSITLVCQDAPNTTDVVLGAFWGAQIPLANLDVSGSYVKKHYLLEFVGRYSTGLKSLNISNNGLSWSRMEDIVLSCSSLTALDVSGNVRFARDWAFSDSQWIKRIAQHLCLMSSLRHLDLSSNAFMPEADALPQLLAACSGLTHLRLDNCNITPDSMRASQEGLSRMSALQQLSLHTNILKEDGLERLALAFAHPRPLTALDLSMTSIGNGDGAVSVAAILAVQTSVTALRLSRNGIGTGLHALAKPLALCTGMKLLDAAFNHIRVDGAVALSGALSQWPSLTSLHLTANSLFASGVKTLASALGQCTSLQHLLLAHNHMELEGAQALAGALQHCRHLQHVDFADNDLDATAMQLLALVLKRCSKLHTLRLECNEIGDDGAALVAAVMEHCDALVAVYVSQNQIGPGGARQLAKAIERSKALRRFSAGQNQLEEGRVLLQKSAASCRTLQSVDL